MGEAFAFFCWARLTGEQWYSLHHPNWWYCCGCRRWHRSYALVEVDKNG